MPPAPSRFSLHRSLFPSSQRATRHHTLSSDLFPQQDPRPCPPPRPTKKHRIPFYRRKIKSPPSHSMSFSLHISSIVSDFNLDSSSKPSFFSRVVNKVVPCVTDSPLPNQPKHICYPESHVSEIKLAVLQSPSTTDPPLVPLPLVVPIFPPSGFDDATPNAFQSQDTESSIPTATIPDKQVAMLDDLELMRNGGNGIPMGPVSIPFSFSATHTVTLLIYRTVFQNHYYLQSLRNMSVVNVLYSTSTKLSFIVASRYLPYLVPRLPLYLLSV